MLTGDDIETARHALVHLRAAQPDLEWAHSVLRLVDALPEADAGAAFVDDVAKDVQIVPKPGAGAVIFAFCGRRHRLGISLSMVHRWLTRLDASVVYLRDFQSAHYLGGIRSLGPRPQTLTTLRGVADDLGARRLLCLGSSSGGYGSLVYGLELGAEAVLSIGGSVNLEPEFNTYLHNIRTAVELRRRFPGQTLDVRALYLAATLRPRVVLVYGQQHWDDRLQNEHMRNVPGVTLAPVLGYDGHGPIPELMRRGEFAALVESFVAGGSAA
jgi:hypothetical protein